MSQRVLIDVKNVGKRYWLYNRYRERLQQLFLAPLTHHSYAKTFWALKGVSFTVREGETLGVIGVNGSGKSTLLQIIAGTLQPTEGTAVVKGRLTALLELGAGFHPEFSGRENLFLSGATLGIPESEMKRRFDQIVDFAEIGQFIDQPVKLYSSGMYVRLAFAIATSIDPEILVVDEALAVGDFGFVIKCMHRMQQLKDQGTAIVLVTHDVQTVRSFCDTALWLTNGLPSAYGSPLDVTSQYIQYLWNQQPGTASPGDETEPASEPNGSWQVEDEFISLQDRPDLIRWGNGGIKILGYKITNERENSVQTFEYGQKLKVSVRLLAQNDINSEQIGIGIGLRNNKGLDIINPTTYDAGNRLPPLEEGQIVHATFEFENILAPGDYALVINAEDRMCNPPSYYDYIENAATIKVVSKMPIFSMVLPEVKQTVEVGNKRNSEDEIATH